MSSEDGISVSGSRGKGRRASITRQKATEGDNLLADVLPTALTIATGDTASPGVQTTACTCCAPFTSCLVKLSPAASSTVSTPPGSTRCTSCAHQTQLETLQIPTTSRLRCDSGNGSDIALHSSGNVSPAGSDYGGGGRLYTETDSSDSLSRKLSKDSSLGTTDSESGEASTTPTAPSNQLLESTTPTNLFIEAGSDGMMTPTVRVWPAAPPLSPGLEKQEAEMSEEQKPSEGEVYRWQLTSIDREEWGDILADEGREKDTPQSPTTQSPGAQSIPVKHFSIGDFAHNNDSNRSSNTSSHDDTLISSPPTVLHVVTRQLSESSSSQSAYHSRVMSRPSADSLSSLDGYFSNMHYPYHSGAELPDYHHTHNNHSIVSDSAFLPPSSNSNYYTPSTTRRTSAPTEEAISSPSAEKDLAYGLDAPCKVSKEGSNANGSVKPQKRRSLRERLSEKHLRTLKVDVSLKESPQANSAPVENEVQPLFNSYNQQVQPDSVSIDSVLSTLHTPSTPYLEHIKDPLKRWQALKGIMPFMESYKKQKWVQLAGHQGSFEQSTEESLVLKRFCQLEHSAFKKLSNDPLRAFIPKYHGMINKDGHQYGKLENLLHGFSTPSVMDCKIGIRTYLEEELCKAEKCPTPRKDMYEKMMKIDPSEPTLAEHEVKAVSKPRYMQWREDISSTSTMGFRIEGIKCSDGKSCINFKTSKDKLTIKTIISGFLSNNSLIVRQCLNRLKQLRVTLDQSPFFARHEIIGSSLLFIHDGVEAGVWMIDFGKTTTLPEGISITHRIPWKRGNHEDGYLIGLDNLITLLQAILEECVNREASRNRVQTTQHETILDPTDSSPVNNVSQSIVTDQSESDRYSESHLVETVSRPASVKENSDSALAAPASGLQSVNKNNDSHSLSETNESV